MKVFRRALLGLATLGLLVACTGVRAAVMTGAVVADGASGNYSISYILAQDVTSLQVKIYNSADVLIKTISTSDNTLWTKGPHQSAIAWDGTKDGGGAADIADGYYCTIATTGAANSALSVLTLPVSQVDPANSAKNDGRFYYGFGVNTNANSPFHNLAYAVSYSNGNAGQESGVYVVNPDGTTNTVLATSPQVTVNWIADAVLSDDKILTLGQNDGKIAILNPDGTVYKNPTVSNATLVYSRCVRAFGTGDNAKIWFIDAGSTGQTAGSVSYIDLGATTPTLTNLVLQSALPTAGRDVEVRPDGSAMWVSGRSAAWVRKYNNVGGVWTLDPTFVFTNPAATPASAVNAFTRLSPDGNTLWIAVNDNLALGGANAVIQGVDPNTGASKGAAYTLAAMPFAPEEMACSANGNLYVQNYTGADTGTTGRAFALVAPPDSGSTDITRSSTFPVTNDATVRFAVAPTVTQITYHSALVTWTTNYSSDSVVNYGVNSGAPDTTAQSAILTTKHSVLLENLDQNMKYYFTVHSNKTGFTPADTTESSFTTKPLVITASTVKVAAVTDTTATLTWTTDAASISIVNVGLTAGGPYTSVTTSNTLVTAHSVTVIHLKPLTPYFFTVASRWTDSTTTATTSAEGTFTTLDAPWVVSENLDAQRTTATLNVSTNLALAGSLRWGTAPGTLTNTAITAASGTAHTFAFTGLTAGTTYYYAIDFTGTGIAPLTTPTGAFATQIVGGAAGTFTHSTAADIKPSVRTNLAVGAGAGLISLEHQGVPGAPISGPDVPVARNYAAVVAYNGYMYVVGGRANVGGVGTQTPDVYFNSIGADGTLGATWGTTTPLPQERAFMNNACFGFNGFIYAIGGEKADGTTMTTVYYAKQNADGTLGAWSTGTPLPSERDLGSAIVVDGNIVVSGGEDNAGSVYATNFVAPIHADGSVGAWYTAKILSYARWFQRTVSNDHKVYSFGGYNGTDGFFNTVDISKVQPNSALGNFFLANSDPNHPDATTDGAHYSCAAGMLGGKIITAAGRYNSDSPHSLIAMTKLGVDGIPDVWSVVAPDGDLAAYPVSVLDNDGQAYNGELYCAGGRGTFGVSTDPSASSVVIPMVADPNDAGYAYAGSLTGSVIDLGAVTNLKHLTVSGSGTGVEVRYRYANTDGIFTDWFTPASLSADITGGARYFQYQLVLSSTGASTPVVNSVTLTTVAGVLPVVPYDVNKDGVIDAKDVKAALQIAAGLLNANDPTVSFANGNVVTGSTPEAIDLLDALAIARHINGR